MRKVSRKEWGARRPRRPNIPLVGKARDSQKVHWLGVGVLPQTEAQERELMRNIQNFHMNTRGWNDIAYGSVIGNVTGKLYIGRGIKKMSAANGPGFNRQHGAVCVMHSQDGNGFTKPARETLGEFLREYASEDAALHRDDYGTTCPGDAIAAWVQSGKWQEEDLTEYPARYVWWRAWRCSIGPWEGKGKKEAGAKYRPKIPSRLDPRWANWWRKFIGSGGCK